MRSDLELLQHMLQEMDFLISDLKGRTAAEFLADETRKRAYARSLEIIGEAAKGLSSDLVAAHDQIEWRSMAAMRDRLIHGYFSVDYTVVWDVVTNKLPGLRLKISQIVEGLKTPEE